MGTGFEVRGLWPNDANALTSRRFQDPPVFDLADSSLSEFFKPGDFGIDGVGPDVGVKPNRVIKLIDRIVRALKTRVPGTDEANSSSWPKPRNAIARLGSLASRAHCRRPDSS